MIIGVTGHRPNKLDKIKYGYDLTKPGWVDLRTKFKDILIKNNCTEAISGMALGVDMNYCIAVLELRQAGHNIKLHCAVPCIDQDATWINQKDKDLFRKILSVADIVHEAPVPYSPFAMEQRNMYIVDHSDGLIAVWNGDMSGGTHNCIEYAKKKQKNIIYITP